MTTQLSDQQTSAARIASDLIENGMIVATDGHTLHTYDESLGRYVPAEDPDQGRPDPTTRRVLDAQKGRHRPQLAFRLRSETVGRTAARPRKCP